MIMEVNILIFLTLKTSFYCKYKPHMPKIYFAYSVWTSFRGIHLLILNLKALRVSDCFISLGTSSNIFGLR